MYEVFTAFEYTYKYILIIIMDDSCLIKNSVDFCRDFRDRMQIIEGKRGTSSVGLKYSQCLVCESRGNSSKILPVISV